MERLIEFPLDDGSTLRLAAADVDLPAGPVPASRGEQLLKAGETLERAFARVIPALTVVASRLRELSPDQLSVEFGLTLTAESGVIVAKGGAEVHFRVNLAWSRSPGEQAPPPPAPPAED
jgi:hypothetical protein